MRLKPPLIYIKLVNGQKTLIDKESASLVSKYKWRLHSGGYVIAIGKECYMHRLIMKTPKGMDTDHINGNKLDNRKRNLRVCTRSENNWNGSKKRTNKSGYKGVSWDKKAGKWLAKICKKRKQIFIGYFNTPLQAATAYDKKAQELFKEFAKKNNPTFNL